LKLSKIYFLIYFLIKTNHPSSLGSTYTIPHLDMVAGDA